MNTELKYEFENANSKIIMDIESGKIEENANLQQWGTDHFKSQQWILKALGGNYYYIRSSNDQNYVLKPTNNTNGGNICIVSYKTNDCSMLFKFSKKPDGSYMIMTRAARDACYIEVVNSSVLSEGNVQQWASTNNACQNWYANIISNDEISANFNTIRIDIFKDNDCVHTVVFVK